MSDLQMKQAIAFVELLCEEMTELQIAAALEQWECLCEQEGWCRPIELEIGRP
jgi:hypothetical protein